MRVIRHFPWLCENSISELSFHSNWEAPRPIQETFCKRCQADCCLIVARLGAKCPSTIDGLLQ